VDEATAHIRVACLGRLGWRTVGGMAKLVDRVIVFVQENHTTDNYFRAMRAWGADVATGWPPQPNPPKHDQPHLRAAYAKWLHAQHDATPTPAAHTQIDTDTGLPFYSYLAKTGAFLDNHCCGFGTNSTPNHLLIVGGQTPTLRNPARTQPDPLWDMPSLPGHAADHGLTWKVYAGRLGYPVNFYTQLKALPNIAASDDIVADATSETLPDLSMVGHDSRTTSTRSPMSRSGRTRSGRPWTPSPPATCGIAPCFC
jgi:phospholipase C